ncbi:melanoma-associated antigen 8-like, partial [Eumetopias jubatus]|uniref:melanoma-associated antigen 8-like n=1 Tax=Eumetopias jubatus TaxID=34886 RepID=UPI00101600F6
PREEPEEAQPGLQNLLQGKLAELVEFLLLKYHIKEPTSQAEMLEIISQDALDAFLVILGHASECLQLVFGMDVKEVDPSDHSYILVSILGLTYDGMLSGEHGVPKTGLLVVLLGPGHLAYLLGLWTEITGHCPRDELERRKNGRSKEQGSEAEEIEVCWFF